MSETFPSGIENVSPIKGIIPSGWDRCDAPAAQLFDQLRPARAVHAYPHREVGAGALPSVRGPLEEVLRNKNVFWETGIFF